MTAKHRPGTEASRFVALLRREGECYVYTGERDKDGYGIFPLGRGRTVSAHRFAYRLWLGPIPPGMELCHRCDNPPCCRHTHLFLGTRRDNVRDAMAKGRMAVGAANSNARLTAEDVRQIRRLEAEGVTTAILATRFGISQTHVRGIVRRQAWPTLV